MAKLLNGTDQIGRIATAGVDRDCPILTMTQSTKRLCQIWWCSVRQSQRAGKSACSGFLGSAEWR